MVDETKVSSDATNFVAVEIKFDDGSAMRWALRPDDDRIMVAFDWLQDTLGQPDTIKP